jgi:CHAT domain-containing protein
MEGREFSFYRNHVIHRVSNTRSFDFFWRPLEPHLKDISTIYVSPDGVFNKISLSTLYDPTGKTYLHSKYKFIALTNLQELVSYRPTKSSAKQEAVLIGHAKFGNSDSRKLPSNLQRSLSFSQVEELIGTKKEVEEISQLMKNSAWQGSLLMGDEASEKSIKSIKKASLLHIATHGFFVPTSDEDEVVVFSNESEKLSNPMWRSGLILSDINSSTSKPASSEDGLLTAYEVKNLDFGNSELVVLSACETGSGEIRNGEGVYGLQRAFMIGGAKNVLMSLWKVDDTATQELMVLFYKDYLSGKDSYSSLRTAQLELMKKYTDPYFWGSFVLIGNP